MINMVATTLMAKRGVTVQQDDLTIINTTGIAGWQDGLGTPLNWQDNTTRFKPNGADPLSGRVYKFGWFGLSGPWSFDMSIDYPDGDPGVNWLESVTIEKADGSFITYTVKDDLGAYFYAGGKAQWEFDEGGSIYWTINGQIREVTIRG